MFHKITFILAKNVLILTSKRYTVLKVIEGKPKKKQIFMLIRMIYNTLKSKSRFFNKVV